ncbi:hypothetical protein N9W09_02570 [Crocinitomicaceae bacterium]|jgi:hypothetical protein|nr:hypothetical protein [Crocinitomicaceae bacterium]
MSKAGWQNWIELSFSKVFSEKNKNTIERFTINVSILGFIIHLLLILGKKYDVFHSRIDNILLTDPISAIYTPFSIILIYEIYLLIHYLPRSFTTSVSKQFEIISLIVIRRIFADIPHIEITASWLNSPSNLQLIYDLIGILVLFFLIFLFNKSRDKIMPSRLTSNLRRFVNSKRAISLVLLPVLALTSAYTLVSWIHMQFFSPSVINSFQLNAIFYNEFFTILILADVFILLLSFQYTERYSQLIRNTGFVICTILIRLSFSTNGLTNIALIVSSVIFGLLVLRIYQATEHLEVKKA